MTTTPGNICTLGYDLISAFTKRWHKTRHRILHLLAFALVACSVLPVKAQVATGDILGTVLDSSGAAIPGAALHLENTGTHEERNTKSSGSGEYVFSSLQPGTYVVTVVSPTFKTYSASNIVVLASDRVRIDAKLQVGGTDEKVEVTATPSSLQTDNTTVGTTITDKTLVDAPLNGRNYFNLVQVQAGVNAGSSSSLSSGNNQTDRRLSASVSANGQQEIFNNNLVDGLDNNGRTFGAVLIRPSVEAIGEVRTDINLYNAELGRTSGAVINVITRSGANQFHGSVYEFFRNDITDSRNFFATTTSLSRKPELRQNQFGGSVSGPIVRDKTFFFADFESFRRIDANNTVYVSTVPTAIEQATPGYLADRGQTNIPAAQIDPTALAYFKLFPLPNLPGSNNGLANNYLSDPSASLITNTGDLRIDHHFSQKDSIFGRYSYNHTSAFTPSAFPSVNGISAGGNLQGPGSDTIPVDGGQISYTHIYTPNLLMELKMGYTFFGGSILPANFGQNLNNTAPYLIPNANQCAICSGLSLINITGLSPLGDPATEPSFVGEHNTQFQGAVTYTRARHTIKTGASLIRRNFSLQNSLFPKGYNIFPSFTNFFHGAPFIDNRQLIVQKPYDRMWEPSGFIQDNWRATDNLTLSLGVRYDVFTKPNAKYGNYSNFDLGSLSIINNATGGITNQYHDVSPRLGFDATVAPGTVVRGGFGLSFYDGDSNTGLVLNNPPVGFGSGTIVSVRPISIAGVPPVVVQSTATASLSGALTSKPLHEPDNYVEQYNLLVQKEFGGTVITLGYVGQVGRHLSNDTPNVDLPAPAGPSAAGTAAPALVYAKQLPLVNTITSYRNNGVSSYNSAQVTVERRITRGLTANVNYTYARNLDDLLAVFDGDVTGTNGFGDLPNQINTYDFGNSALDLRDRFAGFFSYDLPFGKDGSHLNKAVLGGFRFNGLGFWQTGAPFTVTSSVDQTTGPSTGLATINLPTINTDRPNLAAHVVTNGSLTQFFNINAFAQQPLGTAGDEGRNQFYGPHLRRGDLSLFKTIPIHEGTQLELRAECLNITNTPNFDRPNHTITQYNTVGLTPAQIAPGGFSALSTSGFGTITNTLAGYSGRQFQFAGRFSF